MRRTYISPFSPLEEAEAGVGDVFEGFLLGSLGLGLAGQAPRPPRTRRCTRPTPRRPCRRSPSSCRAGTATRPRSARGRRRSRCWRGNPCAPPASRSRTPGRGRASQRLRRRPKRPGPRRSRPRPTGRRHQREDRQQADPHHLALMRPCFFISAAAAATSSWISLVDPFRVRGLALARPDELVGLQVVDQGLDVDDGVGAQVARFVDRAPAVAVVAGAPERAVVGGAPHVASRRGADLLLRAQGAHHHHAHDAGLVEEDLGPLLVAGLVGRDEVVGGDGVDPAPLELARQLALGAEARGLVGAHHHGRHLLALEAQGLGLRVLPGRVELGGGAGSEGEGQGQARSEDHCSSHGVLAPLFRSSYGVARLSLRALQVLAEARLDAVAHLAHEHAREHPRGRIEARPVERQEIEALAVRRWHPRHDLERGVEEVARVEQLVGDEGAPRALVQGHVVGGDHGFQPEGVLRPVEDILGVGQLRLGVGHEVVVELLHVIGEVGRVREEGAVFRGAGLALLLVHDGAERVGAALGVGGCVVHERLVEEGHRLGLGARRRPVDLRDHPEPLVPQLHVAAPGLALLECGDVVGRMVEAFQVLQAGRGSRRSPSPGSGGPAGSAGCPAPA